MRTSEAIASDILRRRDRFITERQKRRSAGVGIGVLCVCAAAVLAAALYPYDFPKSENGVNSASGSGGARPDVPAVMDAAPESGGGETADTAAPEDERPVIRSYGGVSDACYAMPEAGEVGISVPLLDAMREYGDTVKYAVSVHVFSGATPAPVEKRAETLTVGEIENYAGRADPACGYMLFLADE